MYQVFILCPLSLSLSSQAKAFVADPSAFAALTAAAAPAVEETKEETQEAAKEESEEESDEEDMLGLFDM